MANRVNKQLLATVRVETISIQFIFSSSWSFEALVSHPQRHRDANLNRRQSTLSTNSTMSSFMIEPAAALSLSLTPSLSISHSSAVYYARDQLRIHAQRSKQSTRVLQRQQQQRTGGEVSGMVLSGGEVIGVDSVGKGVRGGVVSSTGRVTVGVGACVVFFPASTAETRVVIMAMADWIFMIYIYFVYC